MKQPTDAAPMNVVKDEKNVPEPQQQPRPIDLWNVYQIKVKITNPQNKFTFAEGIVIAENIEQAKEAVMNASANSHPGHGILFCKSTALKADFLLQYKAPIEKEEHRDGGKTVSATAAKKNGQAKPKPETKKENIQKPPAAKKLFNITKPRRQNPKK